MIYDRIASYYHKMSKPTKGMDGEDVADKNTNDLIQIPRGLETGKDDDLMENK
jgi:hypothetical protein